MPKYRIRVDFDGDVTEYVVDKECLEEAEWEASDRLRDMIYNRCSSWAEEVTDDEA